MFWSRAAIFSLCALVTLSTLGSTLYVNAISAGPSIPPEPNTITKYCNGGTCSTGTLNKLNMSFTSQHFNLISIYLSQTCQIMNRNNIPGCPNLNEIIPFDTSNQAISGKFILINGTEQRTLPQTKNHYLWYGTNRTNAAVCVDCELDVRGASNSQSIIIEPHDFVWTDKGYNYSQTDNREFIKYHGRFIEGCHTATLSYTSYEFLADTIFYLRHNCDPKFTMFNNTETYILPSTPIDYNNPYSSLQQKAYLQNIFNGHYSNGNHTGGGQGPTNCITQQCNYKDPYAKVGYK